MNFWNNFVGVEFGHQKSLSIRITQNRRMYVLSIYPGPHKRHTYKMLLTIVSDVCKACLQLLPSARFPDDDFIYLPTFF